MQTTNRFKLQPLIRVLTLFLSLSFAVIGTGCAGGTRGTNISGTGTVRSETGVPVQNATVTNPYNQRTATTDTDGNFSLRELALDPNTPTSLVVLDDNKEYITKEFILSEGNSTSFALEITLPSEPNEPAEVKVTQPKSTGSSGEDGVQNLNGNSDFSSDSGPTPTPTPTPSSAPSRRPSPSNNSNSSPIPNPSQVSPPNSTSGEDNSSGSSNSSPSTAPGSGSTSNAGNTTGGGNSNEPLLEECVTTRFFTQGVPNLSCEQPCLNEPPSQFITDCREFISYLSQVFIPYCANDPCASECELTHLLFPETRTGTIVSQGFENANCGRE